MMPWMRQRIGMNSRLVDDIGPTIVTLVDFNEWLKWDSSEEENTRMACLTAAIKQAEQYTRRTLLRSTWRTYLECFPSCVTLDVLPVVTSSIVVKYFDVDNVEQTLATTEYFVKDNREDYTEIIFHGTMPSIYDRYEPIYIEYTAGYEDGYLPEGIKVGILRKATDSFEKREDESNSTQEAHKMWFPYKML